MAEMLDEKGSIESTTIGVYRTSTTVKGGRRFSFGGLVVIGNRNGEVGFGYAKGTEVPQAIQKAQRAAQRNMKKVTRIGTTIHHQVQGGFSAATVRLIPAAPGTGVVAGTVVRAVLELAGIQDCLTKCYGSTNPQNVLKAVFDAIDQLHTPEQIAELRSQTLEPTEIAAKIEKGKAFVPAAKKSDKAKGPVNTLGMDKGGRGRGGPGGGRGPRRDRATIAESGAPTDAPKA
jgi:small subunit ribosomal protein S5